MLWATLTHLSCSPNFPRASYVNERMLMHEPNNYCSTVQVIQCVDRFLSVSVQQHLVKEVKKTLKLKSFACQKGQKMSLNIKDILNHLPTCIPLKEIIKFFFLGTSPAWT